ncbi:MAG: topoisomerase [Pseudonocardiales bacterium]|nr:topoisomerase [Pseudonocardiales bacterium]
MPTETVRLRRSRPDTAGVQRRRAGRGFRYIDCDGLPVRDQATLERIAALAIPPAWRDVWICPAPNGHIQALGTDAAGRRQYLYHERWRVRRDRQKFDRMLTFGAKLPSVRRKWRAQVSADGLDAPRVLAATGLLLDRGLFRVGGERYALDNGSYGLATLERRHARVRGRQEVQFDYIAKSGVHRVESVADAGIAAVVAELKRRRDPEPTLFAYRTAAGWAHVRSDQINQHLRESFALEISAKDFRTWHATVLMAAQLAAAPEAPSQRGRDRVVTAAVKVVAEALGNTPTVCRASYIDPRVIDHFNRGSVIALPYRGGSRPEPGLDAHADTALQQRIERAVLELLG